MAIEAVVSEAVAHAGVGIVLAVADFLTAQFTNPTASRIQQKTRYVQAIDRILDAESAPSELPTSVPAKASVEYAEQIGMVRDYLRRAGLVTLQAPFFQRVKDGFRHLLAHEKINTLAALPKLGIAAALEIVYDVVFEFQRRGAAGIAASLYQIPALFAGLWAGTWLNKLLNLFMSSADERKLDHTLNTLLKETAIVDIVMAYEPPEAVQAELDSRGLNLYVSRLTRAGKGAYTHLQHLAENAKDAAESVRDAAGDIASFPQKQQEHDAQEREARRKRFDELTKHH